MKLTHTHPHASQEIMKKRESGGLATKNDDAIVKQ